MEAMEIDVEQAPDLDAAILQSPAWKFLSSEWEGGSQQIRRGIILLILEEVLRFAGTDDDTCVEVIRALNANDYNVIHEAIRLRNFRSLLSYVPRKTSISVITPAPKNANEGSWSTPWFGETHTLLADYIVNTNRENLGQFVNSALFYSIFLSISGSQVLMVGCGLPHAPRLHPSLYCLGFPFPDPGILNFFLYSFRHIEIRYISFFAALFKVVCHHIKEPIVAEDWKTLLEGNEGQTKCDIYGDVLNGAMVHLTQASGTPEEAYYRILDIAQAELAKLVQILNLTKDDPMVLSFDECHTLTRSYGSFLLHDSTMAPQATATTEATRREPSALHLLRRVLGEFSAYPIFTIFLSTNPKLLDAALSDSRHPSSRSSERLFADLNVLQTPFVELPFDIRWDNAPFIREYELTLKDVCEIGYIARFGRPLWWTRYQHGNEGVQRHLVTFAMAKLNASTNVTLKGDQARFAALSMRILLEFEPSLEPAQNKKMRDWAEQQVESHMRIVYSIPKHQEYLRSGTPSEPILAEAAAQLLNNSIKAGFNVVEFLADTLHTLVKKGERGELAARTLLILAHDRAIRDYLRTTSDQIQYGRPVPLLSFLKSLFAPSHHDTVLTLCPAQPKLPRTPLKNVLQDACVHFTHFAKAADDSVLSTAGLWKAAARGIAWQCSDHDIVDVIIPIIMRPGERLGRNNVSALLIQIRNSAKATEVVVTENLGRRSFADSNVIQPFIFLAMQLGTQPKLGPAPVTNTGNPPPTPFTGSSVQVSEDPPRYHLTALGLSPNVYSVVTEAEHPKWKQLCTGKSVINEHPRQGPRYLDAIRAYKPYFARGSTAFGWGADATDNGAPSAGTADSQDEGGEGISGQYD